MFVRSWCGRCLLLVSALAVCVLTQHAALAQGSGLHATTSSLPLALARLPKAELRDVDCERVHSGIVDWNTLRLSVRDADAEWQAAHELPKQACTSFLETDKDYSDVLIVMARPADAAVECVLGALAAVLVLLVCAAECPEQATTASTALFENLWHATLTGDNAVPAYMLGTSAWPVASLLAKWQAHCIWANPGSTSFHTAMCSGDEITDFSRASYGPSEKDLMPMLWKQNYVGTERALGVFASAVFRPLAVFINSASAALKHNEQCTGAAVAQGCLLILFRLLGPPVAFDPLHVPRLTALGSTLAKLSLGELIQGVPWPSMAVLATSRYLTWRTHHIYRLEVPLVEIKRVLRMGVQHLVERKAERPKPARWRGTKVCEALRGDVVARRRLWAEIIVDKELGALWRQLARWLASGETFEEENLPRSGRQSWSATRTSSPVFMTMGFGFIEEKWLVGFLNRAVDVRLRRLIFVTPDKSWLLICERVRQQRMAEKSILCVRSFNPQSRPYDYNNKAKFYLYPILFSLGVDVAWLDLDIYVFKDPSPRLLEQAYGLPDNVKDVLVTDHFDEHCLNHGVFMVRASDRSLLWLLRYIEWLHWYPFGHDQNGWDAFLAHSIIEPQLPDNLRTDPAINVSYGVLSTESEYVTLTAWSGKFFDEALLLHYTTTQGISFADKKKGVLDAFNATAMRHPGDQDSLSGRRFDAARWKALHKLRAPRPISKRPCYEGIHMAVGQLLETGFYEELLA